MIMLMKEEEFIREASGFPMTGRGRTSVMMPFLSVDVAAR